jgi:ataxia telangiectasia mutated family protein
MKAEHDRSGSTVESKLKVYKAIEAHLRPVLGSIFFKMYRNPLEWYCNRGNFVRSVATSSIAGFILGIGDRHSQNLLFDKTTGEIIHIDLGIAFDQGKLLSTPELVPFRLTRNIVNAMGMTKYHGVFKRSCEETLQVLRDEHDILFTLLDVFRYDPLYTWTVSPLKMVNLQRDEDQGNDAQLYRSSQSEENDEAGIALFGIRKKLSASISVEGQVQELINQAMDPRNLCRMFPGWQAWI